jgi:transposase, IS5 family
MTDDFFRSRLDQMIDPRHALAVLAQRLPWEKIEASLAPQFAHQARPVQQREQAPDLLGDVVSSSGGKVSNAGRPRLCKRLMVALTLLKNSFNLSDEELVQRFAENVYWQYFAGYDYFDPRPPCDATQIGRFRASLGEAGLEELLSATIHTAVDVGAVKKSEFERVIVDTTVQEKAIAHPVDSRLLDIARRKVVAAAKRCGLLLKQTFEAEGRALRRQAGGYAHAKQFKRLKRVVKRQRTILGIVIREVRRKLQANATANNAVVLNSMNMWLERAERIRTQQRHDKNKLYALHAPEVECIGKGKARKPYEFGVKVSIAVTHKQGLMVGARSFPGNPYDGHILSAQMEQSAILLQDLGVKPKQAVVDLGFRGKAVDQANPGLDILHRGRIKTMTKAQRRWLKRRPAVEPAIGHLKSDNRMQRCWLAGATGDALHALCCAVGYNLRWLMRAVVRLGLRGFLFALVLMHSVASLASRYAVYRPQTSHAKTAPA